MHVKRHLRSDILKSLSYSPSVAILGPRQCGKTTLAKKVLENYKDAIYLDLEKLTDLDKLKEPQYYFEKNENRLICLDEVQNKPEIFSLIRSMIDQNRIPGRFLFLGSASQDLIKQSSQTLAGRISYYELTPLTVNEVCHLEDRLTDHWLRGGFPDSFLAPSNEHSYKWRDDFIRTFVERDLGELGFNLNSIQIKRFWTMLAHYHSSTLNKSTLAQSLGVDASTIQRWLDIFEQTFMVRVLRPYFSNLKKRLVKTPKVYIRDSGIVHRLLNLMGFEDVVGHPIAGASWEGYATENILTRMEDWEPSFYRTAKGEEIDLILEKSGKKIAVEFKVSVESGLEKGSYTAMNDLEIDLIHIVAPNGTGEQIKENVRWDTIETFLEFHGVE